MGIPTGNDPFWNRTTLRYSELYWYKFKLSWWVFEKNHIFHQFSPKITRNYPGILYVKRFALSKRCVKKMLIQWILKEQVEEEANVSALIDKYKGHKNDFNYDYHIKRD